MFHIYTDPAPQCFLETNLDWSSSVVRLLLFPWFFFLFCFFNSSGQFDSARATYVSMLNSSPHVLKGYFPTYSTFDLSVALLEALFDKGFQLF